MKIIECPHCITKVGIGADGQCPSCRKNINDPVAGNRDLTSMRIRHLASLAPICFGCGCSTQRYVLVEREISHAVEEDEDGTILHLLFSVFLLPFVIFFSKPERTKDSVSIRIPQCESCEHSGQPEPRHVDSENLNMTFVVHKEFKKKQEISNSK